MKVLGIKENVGGVDGVERAHLGGASSGRKCHLSDPCRPPSPRCPDWARIEATCHEADTGMTRGERGHVEESLSLYTSLSKSMPLSYCNVDDSYFFQQFVD